jgi:hypothetical protein
MTTGGIRGTHADSCVACLTGTDTALGFVGEAEWAIAGLQRLGLPPDQAASTVSYGTGCEPGNVPDGRFQLVVRVCGSCAGAAGFPVGLAAVGENIPAIRQR